MFRNVRLILALIPTIGLLIVFYIASAKHAGNDGIVQKLDSAVTKLTKLNPIAKPDADPSRVALYRWRNREGNVHISSDMPPEGVNAEVFYYSKSTRVAEAPTAAPPNIRSEDKVGDFSENPLRVYTPDGMHELMERSEEIGEVLDYRNYQLEDLIEDL